MNFPSQSISQSINHSTKDSNMPRGLTSYSCYLCAKNTAIPSFCSASCKGPGPDCPTCASFTCGYCKCKGHTIKHCDVLKANKKRKRDEMNSTKRSRTDEDGWSTAPARNRCSSTKAQESVQATKMETSTKYSGLKPEKFSLEGPAPQAPAKPALSGWAAKAASLSSKPDWKDNSKPKPVPADPIGFNTPYQGRWGDDSDDEWECEPTVEPDWNTNWNDM